MDASAAFSFKIPTPTRSRCPAPWTPRDPMTDTMVAIGTFSLAIVAARPGGRLVLAMSVLSKGAEDIVELSDGLLPKGTDS